MEHTNMTFTSPDSEGNAAPAVSGSFKTIWKDAKNRWESANAKEKARTKKANNIAQTVLNNITSKGLDELVVKNEFRNKFKGYKNNKEILKTDIHNASKNTALIIPQDENEDTDEYNEIINSTNFDNISNNIILAEGFLENGIFEEKNGVLTTNQEKIKQESKALVEALDEKNKKRKEYKKETQLEFIKTKLQSKNAQFIANTACDFLNNLSQEDRNQFFRFGLFKRNKNNTDEQLKFISQNGIGKSINEINGEIFTDVEKEIFIKNIVKLHEYEILRLKADGNGYYIDRDKLEQKSKIIPLNKKYREKLAKEITSINKLKSNEPQQLKDDNGIVEWVHENQTALKVGGIALAVFFFPITLGVLGTIGLVTGVGHLVNYGQQWNTKRTLKNEKKEKYRNQLKLENTKKATIVSEALKAFIKLHKEDSENKKTIYISNTNKIIASETEKTKAIKALESIEFGEHTDKINELKKIGAILTSENQIVEYYTPKLDDEDTIKFLAKNYNKIEKIINKEDELKLVDFNAIKNKIEGKPRDANNDETFNFEVDVSEIESRSDDAEPVFQLNTAETAALIYHYCNICNDKSKTNQIDMKALGLINELKIEGIIIEETVDNVKSFKFNESEYNNDDDIDAVKCILLKHPNAVKDYDKFKIATDNISSLNSSTNQVNPNQANASTQQQTTTNKIEPVYITINYEENKESKSKKIDVKLTIANACKQASCQRDESNNIIFTSKTETKTDDGKNNINRFVNLLYDLNILKITDDATSDNNVSLNDEFNDYKSDELIRIFNNYPTTIINYLSDKVAENTDTISATENKEIQLATEQTLKPSITVNGKQLDVQIAIMTACEKISCFSYDDGKDLQFISKIEGDEGNAISSFVKDLFELDINILELQNEKNEVFEVALNSRFTDYNNIYLIKLFEKHEKTINTYLLTHDTI